MSSGNEHLWGFRDPISSWTHYAFLLVVVFGTLMLIRLCRGNRPRQWAMGFFGASAVLLYAASGTYHALLLPPDQLRFFQRLDHSAIYCLIAGTYTPCLAVLLRNRMKKRVLLIIIWTLALAGVVCQWALPALPYWVAVTVYLTMGWLVLIPVLDFIRAVSWRGMRWALYGGLCYTLGAVLDMIGWPVLYAGVVGPHEIFHLCVMAGTACHFVFVAQQVVPYREPAVA